ncbi:MAG: exodeoxyribonuclease VII large subunit [Phycisphaerales bacterium]|nr:exodeoxyribonuclease VII large subunit [Phycisphaerales bacterium]
MIDVFSAAEGQPYKPVAPAPAGSPPVRTVSQVNAMVQKTLASNLPASLLVAGELSNFKVYSKGHAFFTLKDANAELPCVMWRDSLGRLAFTPKDGLAVVAGGYIKLYEPQGKLQFYVDSLLPKGTGALELAFRQLFAKLKEEGLFEVARKRPIPLLPQHIVIITSPTGDVLHDVLTTAYRRYPGLHAMLYPVQVQGSGAASQMAAAIQNVNRCAAALGSVDLILLVRGGGSLEDLWAFNEEVLVRAIAASQIPIATGIGHEPDTTIADFVADLRGPTPTGAAELTIPKAADLAAQLQSLAELAHRDMNQLIQQSSADLRTAGFELTSSVERRCSLAMRNLQNLAAQVQRMEPRHALAQRSHTVFAAQQRLAAAMANCVHSRRQQLATVQQNLVAASPQALLGRFTERLDHLAVALRRATVQSLAAAHLRLSTRQQRLELASPQAVLRRGFSITTTHDGTIIRTAAQVHPGQQITTRTSNGDFNSTVGTLQQGNLF